MGNTEYTAASITVVREASHSDLDTLVEMSLRFLAASQYGALLTVDPDRIRAVCTGLIDGNHGTIFVAERNDQVVGMIGLMVYEHPFSGDMVSGELAWWVNPEHRGGLGLKLLQRAERWASQIGARYLQMGAPNPDVASMYERLGYIKVETNYIKLFNEGSHDLD